MPLNGAGYFNVGRSLEEVVAAEMDWLIKIRTKAEGLMPLCHDTLLPQASVSVSCLILTRLNKHT